MPYSVLAAIGGAAASATFTGIDVVDAVERAALAGFVTFVGAHGKRWAWLVAGALITVPARGPSLVLAVVGLAVIVAASRPERRPRSWGAAGIALLVNAALRYPEGTGPIGPALAAVAVIVLVASGLPHLRSSQRRNARWAIAGSLVFALLAGVGAVAAVALAYGSVQSGGEAARSALDQARDGNGEAAAASLAEANTSFDQASSRVNGVLTAPALLVPGLSQHVQAVQTTVDGGVRISAAADDVVATADYDRLHYDGRLDIGQVAALTVPTRRADAALEQTRRELADLDDARLVPPLRDRLDEFADDVDEARGDTELAARLLEVTPDLFGANGDRRYLVVFLTPAELRGAGGFIGSYAELTAKDGDVELTRSGRTDDLLADQDPGKRTISGPKDYLRRYGRFEPQDYVQDVTLSPDFPSDAQVLRELYPQITGSPIDGVIGVDPTGLAALLQLTGPIEVEGLAEPLTADNAVEILTRTQYLAVPDRAARGEILAEATKLTFQKLTNGSLPAPRKIAQALSGPTRSGHLRLWSPKQAEQAVFEMLGANGALSIPAGSDGFSLIQQNNGNNKLDAYLHRRITYRPKVVASNGLLSGTLRVELSNDVPSLDLPPAVVDNPRGVPKGTNLTWLTLFTPNVVKKATIDGKPLSIGPGSEAGLNAWDTALIQIPAGKTVVVEFDVEGAVDLRKGYRLTILPQPVANPDRFTVELDVEGADGRTTTNALVTDDPLTAPTHLVAPLP